MRKLVCLMLTLMFILSFSTTSFAAKTETETLLNRKEIKSINDKVLKMVLDGEEDSIDNLSEVKKFKEELDKNPEKRAQFLNNIDAADKNKKRLG